jgi:hypothetical protein
MDSRSPVMGYKIALVNNANLNNQFVGEPPVKQFEYASKRLSRAIRKARALAKAGNRSVMLFCVRENGQHFPINYRKAQYEMKNEPANMGARFALNLAIPGTPIETQTKAMALFRVAEMRPDLLQQKA